MSGDIPLRDKLANIKYNIKYINEALTVDVYPLRPSIECVLLHMGLLLLTKQLLSSSSTTANSIVSQYRPNITIEKSP